MIFPYCAYIDPYLKSLDRDLYNTIERKLNSFGFIFVDNLDTFTETARPYFVFKTSEFQSDLYVPRPYDFVFEYRSVNLSLFGEGNLNNTERKLLQFCDTQEFLDLFDQSLFLIPHLFESYIDEKLSSFSVSKKLNRGKLVKTRLTDEYQDFFDRFFENLFKQRPVNTDDLNQMVQAVGEDKGELSFRAFPEYFSGNQFLIKLSSCEFCEILCDNDVLKVKILFVLEFYFSFQQKLNFEKSQWERKKSILESVNYPVAIIDSFGELSFANKFFSQVVPTKKEIKELVDGDFYHFNNDIFKVSIIEQPGEKNLLTLRTSFLEEGSAPSSEELGIVSSSIAHELNNPLGAILAAIDVLLLDDFEEESLEHFHEMRKVVLRCKKLVETFLGFSRSKVFSTSIGKDDFNFSESFNQASDLIRFRLIETNTHMEVLYFKNEAFSYKLNPYILSMIYYLFLGEILTSYSHFCLLDNRESGHLQVSGYEFSDKLEIQFPTYLKLNENLFKSRLIQHLLDGERLEVVLESGSLILQV